MRKDMPRLTKALTWYQYAIHNKNQFYRKEDILKNYINIAYKNIFIDVLYENMDINEENYYYYYGGINFESKMKITDFAFRINENKYRCYFFKMWGRSAYRPSTFLISKKAKLFYINGVIPIFSNYPEDNIKISRVLLSSGESKFDNACDNLKTTPTEAVNVLYKEIYAQM